MDKHGHRINNYLSFWEPLFETMADVAAAKGERLPVLSHNKKEDLILIAFPLLVSRAACTLISTNTSAFVVLGCFDRVRQLCGTKWRFSE